MSTEKQSPNTAGASSETMQLARAIAGELANEIGARFDLAFAATERRLAEKIDVTRNELTSEMRAVRLEQFTMSKAIVSIEQRLGDGDRRFEAIESRLSHMEDRERLLLEALGKLKALAGMPGAAQSEAAPLLTPERKQTMIELGKLFGALAAGAALGWGTK